MFRIIPTRLFTMEELGLPDSATRICDLKNGLVLVTGPTNSGKSTTLSTIINRMNETQRLHIVTIEDPIEFVHPVKQSIITQHEVGSNVSSFSDKLRSALRENPDVILINEIRDLKTISLTLLAAETKLLIFGTLHTNSASKTIDRIINVFPTDEQDGIRNVLNDTLTCVLAQQLLKRKSNGRVAALEILFGSPALGNMIREGKTHQITNLIQQGRRLKIMTMDDCLMQLINDDIVEPEATYQKAIEKPSFRKHIMKNKGLTISTTNEDPKTLEREMMETIKIKI